MIFKDFIFNFRSNLIYLLKKKNYFTFVKRIFLLPYKFITSNLRDIFINQNIDKIFLQENQKPLNEYLKYFDSDKSSLVHGYDRFYSSELEHLKESKIKILEFGIHFGASQAAMSKYFVNSTIIGVDKNPYYKKFYSKKIHSLFCDVSDEVSLHQLTDHLKDEIDIIIDDASHIPYHQLITFIKMFDSLKSGGIYVIEELDVYKSYPEVYGSRFKDDEESVIRKFLYDVKDKINPNLEKNPHNLEISMIKEKIDWIKIFRGDYMVNNKNISEIAFIKKI